MSAVKIPSSRRKPRRPAPAGTREARDPAEGASGATRTSRRNAGFPAGGAPGANRTARRSAGAPAETGSRARGKRDKRERLRAAAWELFTTKGFDETTTREVAERAGVATGTLFLYASDKADLLFLVFEQQLAETVDAAFRSLPAAGLKAQLMHIFGRLFAMYGRIPTLARHFVKELAGSDGPNARSVNGLTLVFLQRVGGLVEEAARRGEVRADVPPLLAAQNIFAVYFMGLLSWLSGFNSLDGALTSTTSSGLDLLMRGLEKRD